MIFPQISINISIIKNPHVRASLACGELKAHRKWCLTGTPVHNSLKDIYPLFRFLEVPVFKEATLFNARFVSCGNRTGALAIQAVLRGLMIRRKKDDKINGRPLIILPEKVYFPQGRQTNLDNGRNLYRIR